MRSPQAVMSLQDAERSPDGTRIAVKIETADSILDVEFTRDTLAETIAVLLSLGEAFGDGVAPRPCHAIPAQGLGFMAGTSPDETRLVVRLGGLDLAFPLANSRVAALGREFAQIAAALSAHTSNAH